MKMYRENFGFNRFNKKLMLSIFSVCIFFFVIFLSVAFSAFDINLVMKDITAEVKFMPDDARVSNFSVNAINNNAVASNTDYNYNRIYGDIRLPDSNSNVVYEIEVTNLGNAKVGISSITGLPPNLSYTISGYKIGDAITDENGQYKLGTTMKLYITIHYAEGAAPVSTVQAFNMLVEFKPLYSITYHGVPGEEEHPTEIMEGLDLVINTELTSIDRLKITQDTVFLVKDEHFFYDEAKQQLTVKNVTGDLLLSYRDVSYLASLNSDDGFYKESTYRTSIRAIEFVDYVDTTGAEKIYDLSENRDQSILGWIIRNEDNTCNLYIGSIYDIYAKNMGKAFYKMTALKSINFKNLNTSESTSFAYTFYETPITSLDLSTFNTSNATSMLDMFAGMTQLETLDVSNFNTSKVTNMWYMFGKLSKLTSLDISTFDTSKVTNMAYMFSGMSKLKSLRLGDNFDTSSVTNMEYMFMGVSSIENLNLSVFKTNNLNNASYMFYNCDSLTSLDLSNFNTENVTNMSYMFHNMDKLTTLNINSFNTSKVKNMEGMFSNCISITDLNLSHFDTSSVTTMEKMFTEMHSLKTLDISTFDLSSVTNMSNFVANSILVETIDMRQAEFTSVRSYSNMFHRVLPAVTIIAKDEDSKAWLEARLEGNGTVIIPTTPPTEGESEEETQT